ncbi:MAG: YdcF family protein [Alphaproteobacteria bacterium]|nr:YdcF family protein [Alphaproteobacteria bacterium]
MSGLSGRKRTRTGTRRRVAGIAAGALVAAWLAGLFVFADTIPRQAQQSREKTDAIVVLTGGSLRLEEGLALLSAQLGKKLFVSGVHRGVDVQQLIDRSLRSPEIIDCCIVLGYAADHTAGNARETADWMARQGYASLRLVTASYHMPRSLAEFRNAMPSIEIIPHPVFPENVKLDEWWRWPGTAILIVGEYNKYLVAESGHRLGRLVNRSLGR